ncbi:MAG: hypothetical protein WDN47_00010 [Candidatus Doudnabacteria bacterium]
MSANVLVLYEIASKAATVKTKKALGEFEEWVRGVSTAHNDASVEKVARIHLFRLRSQFS